MKQDLLLVGSIPLATPLDVFEACADTVADLVPAVPDGETNERIWWVNMLAYKVFQNHPDIETLTRPGKDGEGYPRWKPADVEEMWSFRLKRGVERVRFGDLTYANDAIVSYRLFRLLKEMGRLPADLRFMVSLPMTNSGTDLYFRDPADRAVVHEGFEDAMGREIARMLAVIPPEELMIQWDVCVEVLDIEGFFPWSSADYGFEANTRAFGVFSPQVPETVSMGYHFCYGTLGGWPMLKPRDLTLAVRLANAAAEQSGRRVDYVHMPVPRHVTDDYFTPLSNLSAYAPKVFLGLIHHTDDVDENMRRVAMADRHLSAYGLAAVCGLGRLTPEEVPIILRQHRDIMKAFASRPVAANV